MLDEGRSRPRDTAFAAVFLSILIGISGCSGGDRPLDAGASTDSGRDVASGSGGASGAVGQTGDGGGGGFRFDGGLFDLRLDGLNLDALLSFDAGTFDVNIASCPPGVKTGVACTAGDLLCSAATTACFCVQMSWRCF